MTDEESGRIIPLHLLAMLVQPWLLLAFFAARAHCWLMTSLLATRTPSGSSQQSSSPASVLPAHAIPGESFFPGARLDICHR